MKLTEDDPQSLTQLARRLNWMSATTQVDSLSVAGEGNMNVVLRGHLSDGCSLIFKQSLPFVAKYPQIAAPQERLNFEARFYDVIAANSRLAAATPHIVGYDSGARVMCMADLGEASDFLHVYHKNANLKELETSVTTLLAWLSELHALELPSGLGSDFSNAAMRQLNHEHIFDIPIQPDNGLELEAPQAEFADELRAATSVTDRIHQLGEIYLGNAATESTSCLLHGDFYPGSWIRDSAGQLTVIDPEFCFWGAPEFDVGVLQAHLTFAGMDSDTITRLLTDYRRPVGFAQTLADEFAAVELIRRLLGVAQLPLDASTNNKLSWLNQARTVLEST